MKRTNLFLALFLMAFGLQTMQAQIMKVWHDGRLDVYDVGLVDSVQFVETPYEWVDLGLPSGTLWATFNVGANAPEEYGDHFAWGETVPKEEYIWETYRYFGGYDDDPEHLQEHIISKYNYSDGRKELLPDDDAATVNWGNGYQMPSREQMEELVNSDYTTYEWTFLNGVKGRKITSKINGNSIFLPAAGFFSGTSIYNAGQGGYYWSRSLGSYILAAYELNLSYFNSGKLELSDEERQDGLSIRPVRVQDSPYQWPVLSIELNETSSTLICGETLQLSATVMPEYAKNRKVTWQSSNSNVASVNESGRVTAKAIGTCIITCSATDGSGVKAECKVTVKDHDFVDLGLPSGTLWAAYNVGANAPQERGDHFAWGETAPKQDYNWTTYCYSGDTQNTLTKYCTNSEYGTLDNKTELLPEDDAATANWGDKWQMPSILQLEELLDTINNTQIETVEVEGVRCRKITSRRNGNSIYIPAAGSRFPNRDDFYNDNITGYYWSRTLHTDEPYNARHYIFTYNSKRNWTSSSYYRYAGFTVRAVRKSPMQYVTSIQMDETAIIDLSERKSIRLTATVLPSNATNQTLLWTSSNENIATVDNTGKVEVVTTDTCSCTITCAATDGSGVKAQCKLTILYYQGTTDGHIWVDLGLPSGTLWATQNVGSSYAHTDDEFGDYFAWGETQPNDVYTWKAYKYCNGSEYSLTKYCPNSEYGYNGFTDDLRELLPEDDAATANWGRNWQTPSIEQLIELVNENYTTVQWVSRYTGVNGMLVTSKINGKRIFLRAAGDRVENNNLVGANDRGRYWSRKLVPEPSTRSSYASCLEFSLYLNSLNTTIMSSKRDVGHCVRPVRVPGPAIERPVTQIKLSQTSLILVAGLGHTTRTLSATALPYNASNPHFKWSSSNSDIASVNKDGKVFAIQPGTCTIICTAADGSGTTATCEVKVISNPPYVDLDLPSGTKWASFNIGASSPEEYGELFFWGDTQPMTRCSWDRYKYCVVGDDDTPMFTKYCWNSDYGYNGFADNLTELLLEDDAAAVNWGGFWRMPSMDQIKELLSSRNTTSTWTTQNGVNGLLITSKSNGNSIFLPAAGLNNTFSVSLAGELGSYWSRFGSYNGVGELNDDPSYAFGIHFSSNTNFVYAYSNGKRHVGHSVRPVWKE